ncbi:MAG: LytTR family DNA-binding domain-containing protein [Algoriphagus sp.]|uniref:LytTR family DNA-binding domain-containing protein n=1 Tax=Algoriphagus sp. TaxID=1872435 RepID=UPI0026077BEA|nr:LytTR family DNA-binding domain-containing protein [Algoriphagus sp.]MDG1276546.1 LytTR family DNA-binding domain-containing protein [Algoriphagus sp.]
MLKQKYPFDPSLKHHLIIALGLAVWIFVFLFFTEPLDVSQLDSREKLIYLPIYGLFGSICYLICLPFQFWWLLKMRSWLVSAEFIFFSLLFIVSFISTRSIYYYLVVDADPYAYPILYFATSVYMPAALTVFPIVVFVRWSFGKYKEKRFENEKIEIRGIGNYESLRLQLNDLICIQSSDNYVEVTFKEGEKLKTHLIRNKLMTVEEQVPELIRTHRSFLINPYHFKQWKTGNKKVQVLLSEGIEVPVSKTYLNDLRMMVNLTTE